MKKINLLLAGFGGYTFLCVIPGYREIILLGIIIGFLISKDTPNISGGIKQLIWSSSPLFITCIMFSWIIHSSPEIYKEETRDYLIILTVMTDNLLFIYSRIQGIIVSSGLIKNLEGKSPKYGRVKIMEEIEEEVQNKQNLLTQIILGTSTILFLIFLSISI